MYIQIANSTPCDLYLFLCEFFCFVFVCFLIKDATKPQEIHSDSTVAHSLSAVTSTCSQRVFYWGSGSLSSIMIWETLSLNACRHLLLVCLAGVRLNFNFPEALEKEFTFFFSSSSHSTEAMNGLRRHFNMGLVLLMCTLTGHSSDSAPSPAPNAAATGRDAQQGTRRIVEIVKHVEDSRVRHSTKTKTPFTTQERIAPVEPKDLRNLKTDRGDPAVGEWWLVVWAWPLCWMSTRCCRLKWI